MGTGTGRGLSAVDGPILLGTSTSLFRAIPVVQPGSETDDLIRLLGLSAAAYFRGLGASEDGHGLEFYALDLLVAWPPGTGV